jgi:diguanylate cyclase (GGDEF)-like protein
MLMMARVSGSEPPGAVNNKQDNAALTRTIASTATIKLSQIYESEFFYTPIEERFERITRLARRGLNVPVAAISLINEEKQWFKSVAGWNVNELEIDKSLCQITVASDCLTIIENAATDPRTKDHPLVTGNPHFRFYAGYPLHNEHQSIIGTFCVFDVKARGFNEADRQCLNDCVALTARELHSDELRAAHKALLSKLSVARREAMMDPLTRLWNRRGASVMLKSAFDLADEEEALLAVAILDFDNFKRINDTYGHQTGDDVLRKTASRLVASVRGRDVVCRIGGDEFLILMSGTDEDTARNIVERVREHMTSEPVPTRQGSIPISVSVGFTVRETGEPIDAEQLIERADKGLMQAKSLGRNRVGIAAP